MRKLLIIIMALVPASVLAQFAPAAGFPGTTAMHADSSAFVAWATGCVVERGPQRIDNLSVGLADFGTEADALGFPGGTMNVVSLGDGGKATLTFESPICNGEGPDFAVFENGFANAQNPSLYFLELAFVEVSSDGVNFFRFPAVSNVQTDTQLGGSGCIDPQQIHNFAGKYQDFYGTPFDLDDVEDNPLLDKNRITHIRLIDVVGNIDPEYVTYDSEGHPVNDPWPTPFGSSGFDLDAVGVIHDLEHFAVAENGYENFEIYPNPAHNELVILLNYDNQVNYMIYNLLGQNVKNGTVDGNEIHVDISDLEAGVYFVSVNSSGNVFTKRVIVR